MRSKSNWGSFKWFCISVLKTAILRNLKNKNWQPAASLPEKQLKKQKDKTKDKKKTRLE